MEIHATISYFYHPQLHVGAAWKCRCASKYDTNLSFPEFWNGRKRGMIWNGSTYHILEVTCSAQSYCQGILATATEMGPDIEDTFFILLGNIPHPNRNHKFRPRLELPFFVPVQGALQRNNLGV